MYSYGKYTGMPSSWIFMVNEVRSVYSGCWGAGQHTLLLMVMKQPGNDSHRLVASLWALLLCRMCLCVLRQALWVV